MAKKESTEKDIQEKGLDLIKQTFGYGKPGAHKKKCDICGLYFEEPNDLEILVVNGPFKCPYCKEILELKEEIAKHWKTILDKETDNPIERKNMIKDEPSLSTSWGLTESYTLDQFEKTFEIIGRTKRVMSFIERVNKARKYLYEVIEPHMKILESIYERKDVFWNEGGNLRFYVRNSSLQFVVIKIKEYLSSDSVFSISKIGNIISNDKKYLFDDHHITEIRKFKTSGDIMRTEYPHFEIDKYLSKLNKVVKTYSKTIDSISDFRDNQFAHISKLKKPNDSPKELTYTNLKRIFNSLKIIYDGFCYSVAPDLYANLIYDYQLWFDHLNHIAKLYEVNNKNK